MDLITARNVLAIAAAHKNEGMGTSAESCFIDGLAQVEKGNFKNAVLWGIRSLSHSVGVFHFRYKTACEVAGLDPDTAHRL